MMESPHADIRRRRRLQPHETNFLVRIFEQYPRPSAALRDMIASKLGMSQRGVQIWFQNRRAKAKRDLLEAGHGMLLFAPTIPAVDLFSPVCDFNGVGTGYVDSLDLFPMLSASGAPPVSSSDQSLSLDSSSPKEDLFGPFSINESIMCIDQLDDLLGDPASQSPTEYVGGDYILSE